jgi:hypothetical protein
LALCVGIVLEGMPPERNIATMLIGCGFACGLVAVVIMEIRRFNKKIQQQSREEDQPPHQPFS